MAQIEYSYQIHKWVEKGVPFSTNLYVPETHLLTLAQFHGREDEGHVFLWLWQFLVHVNPNVQSSIVVLPMKRVLPGLHIGFVSRHCTVGSL